MTWQKVVIKGTIEPVKRIHHSANVLANKMILFGGIITEQDKQHDLMLLDLEDLRWDNQVLSMDTKSPPNLMGHTSILSDDSKMWVVGGKSNDLISSLVYTLETGIRTVVEPINYGRSNLPFEMLHAVDDKSLWTDLFLEHNSQMYHLHRAIIRIRCVALYQEYTRLDRINQVNDHHGTTISIDFSSLVTRLSKRKDCPLNMTKITNEIVTSLLEFIYTDSVTKFEDTTDEESIDQNFVETLARLGHILSLDRLEALCNSHRHNATVLPIPPPTLFSDMAHLLVLCQHPNEIQIESLEDIFDTSSETTADSENLYELPAETPVIEPRTPMSSLSNISLASFVDKVLSNDHNAFTDVLFIVDQEERFAAHRFVLLCRSKYFRRMFQTVKERVIEISGIQPAIFRLVLEYLYVGNVNIPYELALELLKAAEVYELERLSLMAQSVLERKLHVHNVCTILNTADYYDIEHLRHACVFFVAHHLNQVKKTFSYKNLLNFEVKLELKEMRKQVRQREEEVGEEEFLFPHSNFYHDKYHRDSKKGKKGVKGKTKKKVSTPSKRKSITFNDQLQDQHLNIEKKKKKSLRT
jgi:hypothetical protein